MSKLIAAPLPSPRGIAIRYCADVADLDKCEAAISALVNAAEQRAARAEAALVALTDDLIARSVDGQVACGHGTWLKACDALKSRAALAQPEECHGPAMTNNKTK